LAPEKEEPNYRTASWERTGNDEWEYQCRNMERPTWWIAWYRATECRKKLPCQPRNGLDGDGSDAAMHGGVGAHLSTVAAAPRWKFHSFPRKWGIIWNFKVPSERRMKNKIYRVSMMQVSDHYDWTKVEYLGRMSRQQSHAHQWVTASHGIP
jgi:hypothetical protein